MLELKSISWQNFLSYGDYVTTVELDKLGQCLITGEVADDGNDQTQIRKSNGAGKSTIPNVIQWVLFGRTMHSRAPGNQVVNWFTGKDCWAKITFKNGDSITRTRNTDGKNELLISKDGDENKFISDTLSTSANQQQQLNRMFGLDWEVFCGSVFFNQYGKPWMEMADVTRKKAIERILHVDRFTYYSQAAKLKCDNLDKLVDKHRQSIESAHSNINRLESELERVLAASKNFISNKEQRIHEINNQINLEINKKKSIELPDIDDLKNRWNIVKQIETKISDLRKELNSINSKISEITGSIQNLDNQIKLWESRSGKICTSCEQSVPKDHISSKIAPILEKKKSKLTELNEFKDRQLALDNKIKGVEKLLLDRRPKMTLDDAKHIHYRSSQCDNEIARLKSNINKISKEQNPHDATMVDIQKRIMDYKSKIDDTRKDLERSELLNKHYHYIYKAYNDRSKIKSFIFRDHIPFINSRLKYYLEVFDLDIKIELTDALGIKSNMWGYEFESGGERKRTDVAFMLAMFDFHEQMYGRQCNILVLDEVDGRLDDDGIDALINIIKTDLAHRVETILVISHRNLMFDTFSREIRVIRKDRFSTLEIV